MQTILINLKDPMVKSIQIMGYVSPASSATRLFIHGVNLFELSKLQPFSKYMMSGFNSVVLDLNHLSYSIIES